MQASVLIRDWLHALAQTFLGDHVVPLLPVRRGLGPELALKLRDGSVRGPWALCLLLAVFTDSPPAGEEGAG